MDFFDFSKEFFLDYFFSFWIFLIFLRVFFWIIFLFLDFFDFSKVFFLDYFFSFWIFLIFLRIFLVDFFSFWIFLIFLRSCLGRFGSFGLGVFWAVWVFWFGCFLGVLGGVLG